MLLNFIKCNFVIISFVLFTVFSCFFFITPVLLLIIFAPKLFRRFVDYVGGIVGMMVSALLSFLLGVNIRISGDRITPGEPAIIVLNHRTRLDWLYFLHAVITLDPCLITTLKISLMDPLKHIPGVGWAMQCLCFLFVKRRMDEKKDVQNYDKRIIHDYVKYFTEMGYKYQILLFPEGIELDPSSKATSDRYALKNNLPVYDHVLHPRTTGFVWLLSNMKEMGYVGAIYDATVFYPEPPFPHSEWDIALGRTAKSVHFQIKKYKIPENDEEAEKWLKDIWYQKEKALASDSLKMNFEPHPTPFLAKFLMITAVIISLLFVVASLHFVIKWFWWMKYLIIIQTTFYVSIPFIYGGMYEVLFKNY